MRYPKFYSASYRYPNQKQEIRPITEGKVLDLLRAAYRLTEAGRQEADGTPREDVRQAREVVKRRLGEDRPREAGEDETMTQEFISLTDFTTIEIALLEEFKTFITPHLPAGVVISRKGWEELLAYYKMVTDSGMPEYITKGHVQKMIGGWWSMGGILPDKEGK